jgi:dinuclear metal center YbgI/SA1388 family protein
MAVALTDILLELGRLLKPEQFNDYCPNGLQVQGRPQVTRLVSGVTASQALIEAAVDNQADAMLVHHGYFWRGEEPVLTGIKLRRIKTLLDHNISLLAYHLPLDAHAEFGNNVQLGRILGLVPTGELAQHNNHAMGLFSDMEKAIEGADLASSIAGALGREPLHIAGSDKTIKRVAWCTGAAQSYIEQAVQIGADAYISGEISEQTVHVARECGIHYFSAGHHATERYGVQALGNWLSHQFDLQHIFIDIDNPV